MKDQVVMSKRTAELAIAIPLFRSHEMDDDNLHYKIKLVVEEPKPLAYVLCIDGHATVMGHDYVESQCEFLGDF